MTVFKDRSKLKPGYVPDELVGREDEFRKLSRLYAPVFDDGASQRAMVHGPGGSGKTALTLRLGRELDRENLRFVYVDCRRHDTHLRISRRLAEGIGLPTTGGSSTSKCLKRLDAHLEREDKRLVAALDWLDFQVSRGDSDLLYYLLRLWECREGGPNRISIIGMSRISDLLDRLEPHVRSSFMHHTVELEDYREEELEKILQRRAELAFRPGAVDDDAIKFISESSPSVDGARMAIDWLLHAGKIASTEGRDKVSLQEVRVAKQLVHQRVARRDLENLSDHGRLLVLAAVAEMRSREEGQASSDEVEERYRRECAERGKTPREHRTVFEKLDRLTDLGIIDRQTAGKGEPSEIRIPGNHPEVLEGVVRELV